MNPVLALIIANIIWGMGAPIFKYALSDIPPMTLAFLRFSIGALLILPFIKLSPIIKISAEDWIRIFLAALTGITFNIIFFFWGLLKTESIASPIIASSGPIFLFIIAIFFLHEKFKTHVAFGLFVSLVGVLTIVISPLLHDGGMTTIMRGIEGNLWYLASTVVGVFMPVILKSVFKNVSPLLVVFIAFVISSITFFPFMLSELLVWSFTQLSMPGIIGILFGAIFSSAIAYYLYCYGLGKISASEIGVYTYIDPVSAVIVAAPLLHEYPDAFFFLGSILILGGIWVSEGRLHWHPFHKLFK